MTGAADPTVVSGQGRDLATGSVDGPIRFELHADHFALVAAGAPPVTAAYRDLSTLAVDQGRVLLMLAGGQRRFIAGQLGSGLATLVGELRERRSRQMLTDRLIDLPADERLQMVEYAAAQEHGVALLAFHPWGFALVPLDERQEWRLVRRADIAAVTPNQSTGRVRVEVVARPGRAAFSVELLGLGLDTVRVAQRIGGLREAAIADAATIVSRLLPDAAPDVRARAAGLLVDGRPVSPAELGDAWVPVERAVLSEPTFAATYRALVDRSAPAGQPARSWIALAPVRPTDPAEHMSWFLVALPGDLLAFELVSPGAHATYLFRARDSLDAAVFDVSEALIDTRFLRSPIYLGDAALAEPENLRHRLAIASLPALRAARARFVGRLIHTDEESWARSLEDALQWNATNRDAAAAWPGSAQAEGD